ncbi:MAG: restriction endonuclease [Gemmatimonadaceae bacterium]|nr:restriction endonuclease [Gemmatimonadaceae bacterium]
MSGSDGSWYWRMLDDVRRRDEQLRRLDEISKGHASLNDPFRRVLKQQGSVEAALRLGQIGDEPFRRAVEQQRKIDEATRSWRLVEQLNIAGRRFDLTSLPSVQKTLEEIHRRVAHLDGSLSRRFEESERLLRLTTRPYPDLSSIDFGAVHQDVQRLYGRLNAGLHDAGLLGEVEFDADGESKADGALQVESRLIEVVPAEALDALKRVEFVPFALLTAAVTDPKILFEVTPRTFEQFIAELMAQLGVEDVLLTPERADGGRDVIGTVRVAGIALIVAFECKRYSVDNPVPVETARALLGTITHGEYRADRGILVTTSRFTEPAHRFILTAPQLEGRDFQAIVEWLQEFAKKGRN